MWISKDSNYTKSDRFCKIVNDDKEVPYFNLYPYTSDTEVDFNNVLEKGKKINGRLIEVYVKDKEFEWKKYQLFGFIFEDKDWIFNISIWEKFMQTRVNKLVDADLTKEIEISVFDSTTDKSDKVYRNFAFWIEWQVLNARISSQDKWDLVKTTTNAAWEVTKDFSLITKTFKWLFDELKYKLEAIKPEQPKELKIEDLEVEKDFSVTDAVKEKEKMVDETLLPF